MSEPVVKILGAREVERMLKRLGGKDAKKVLRKGLRAGAKIIHKEAVRNVGKVSKRPSKKTGVHKVTQGNVVSVRSGNLARSIKVKSQRRSRTGVGVHVMTAEGWFQGPAFYAAFVEMGHLSGKRDVLRATAREKVEGKRMLGMAAATSGPAALVRVMKIIGAEIVKLARK